MKDRIYSLETEYAIAHNTNNPDRVLDKGEIFNLLDTALAGKYNTQCGFSEKRGPIEFKEGRFIENGARFYYDTGHAEWAAPECRSAADAVIFDKAGESVLNELIPLAEKKMRENGYDGNLYIVKNNVDPMGSTYGCHENYLTGRDNDLMRKRDSLNFLITFLVTRQLFCGAGKVGMMDDMISASRPVLYQLSQRADFIYYETSDFTTREPDTRAIVDARDEPLADDNRYRRLHLILGDSNMSEWSSFLKLGTTGIVLRMIEDNHIDRNLALADPIAAIKEISHDPLCKTEVPLNKGRVSTPINLQKEYLKMARNYFSKRDISEETSIILDMWEEVLGALEDDPMLLSTKIDWVIKKKILIRYIEEQRSNWEEVSNWNYVITKTKNVIRERNKNSMPDIRTFIRKNLRRRFDIIEEYMRLKNLDWKDYFHQLKIYYGIRERDIRYHDIDSRRGLYYILHNHEMIESLFYPEDIESGKYNPPSDTRAKIRGDFIKKACNRGTKISVDWTKVKQNGSKRVVWLNDPFSSSDTGVGRLIKV
jgi:proteasome accessory factor A